MSRTLASMRNEVLSHSFDTTRYTPLVNTWLNEAQGRVARRMNLSETAVTVLVATTAGFADYELFDDLIAITGVFDDRGPLTAVPRNDVPSGERTGRPTMYALYSDIMTLYPTPAEDGELTVRYRATITPMATDSAVTAIPGDYDHLLVTYALYKAYRKEDDAQMAQFYWQEFERDLREMRAATQFRDSTHRRRIPGMWARAGSPRFHRP